MEANARSAAEDQREPLPTEPDPRLYVVYDDPDVGLWFTIMVAVMVLAIVAALVFALVESWTS